MIFADVKADVKQQEIEEMVTVSYNFCKKYLKYSNSLILSLKHSWVGGVLLNGQNQLSVKKVICPSSLNRCHYTLTDCQIYHLLKLHDIY